MFCERCGTKLPDEAEFCTNCGVSIAQNSKKVEKIDDTEIQLQVKPTFRFVCTVLPFFAIFGIIMLPMIIMIGMIISSIAIIFTLVVIAVLAITTIIIKTV